MAGQALDQRAVYREVIAAEHLALLCQDHHFGEEALDHCVFKLAVTVLGEARVFPDLVVDGQPDEPAVQQVVAALLDQLAIAAHREGSLG